ncbi:MAG: SDR family NAD(P)-dependent oxidoreductase, partial [Phenylobacterium sp.]|nr:SDR family NAD(P)-dependent oxidoreductase [Phenylobacterium sp.]
MKDFAGKFAVVTGGGTGMGRELARQLIAEGCSVAMCDVSEKAMAETIALCQADGVPQGAKITAHVADVSSEDDLIRFRDEAAKLHDTDKLHLLFNNAGIGGGGSMVAAEDRTEWERTFNVCWGGVYYGVRTFLPMLLNADDAHIINTSSVNGFWASLGPNVSHTAYAAAKFAVKGFTEALITDLRLNAPHIKCSVVMPGHIGTMIAGNSRKVIRGTEDDTLSAEELVRARQRISRMGVAADQITDEAIQAMIAEQA